MEAIAQLWYSLPAENQSILDEITKKEKKLKKEGSEISSKEKKTLEQEMLKRTLRVRAQKEVEKVGILYSNSLYLILPENIEKVNKAVEEIRSLYQTQLNMDIGKRILIIRLNPEDSEVQKIIAEQAIVRGLEGALNALGKVEKAILDRKKGTLRPSEKRGLEEKVELLRNFANKFKVKDEIKNILTDVENKLSNLKKYEAEEDEILQENKKANQKI